MKKVLLFILALCFSVAVANAAVRSGTNANRNTAQQGVSRGISTSPKRVQQSNKSAAAPSIKRKNQTIGSRTESSGTIQGGKIALPSSVLPTPADRPSIGASQKTPRKQAARSASAVRTAKSSARKAVISPSQKIQAGAVMRAAQNQSIPINSKAFGTEYTDCRDAYFTCMDQFCAKQNDAYRRCVCSSRLEEVKAKQNALSQSNEQLQDFKNINIGAIPQTAQEVKAMGSASEGEVAQDRVKDFSESWQELSGIRRILNNYKTESLSTLGTLDIAGDINQIWATTDLISGKNISNLTGEPLYNAVHSQ